MSIRLENVTYSYEGKKKDARKALNHINLEIQQGEFVGIIGQSGSGKSTLVQHLNALLKPVEGKVIYNGEDVYGRKYRKQKLRYDVGMVFQYPEHQMFENTVKKDVIFGPLRQGNTVQECERRAVEALKLMGIEEKYYDMSPFELSGGQKRRAAIAGILAMEPKILVLDEPTAGLDPQGRREILEPIRLLNQEHNVTIILVSHTMEDIAEYTNRVIVMNQGEICMDDTPDKVFWQTEQLDKVGLKAPEVVYVLQTMIKKHVALSEGAVTISQASDEIIKCYRGEKE
jgi:energy-coupling factor transport system ATP-binding protein